MPLICFYLFSQFDITCTDKGNPSKSSATNATVTVPVSRNKNAPVFTSNPFTKTVLSTAAAGDQVLAITFTDADTDVSSFTLMVIGVSFFFPTQI